VYSPSCWMPMRRRAVEDSDSESNAEESSAMSSDEEWQPRLHPNDWRYAGRLTLPN
jgi:hypothetical protein